MTFLEYIDSCEQMGFSKTNTRMKTLIYSYTGTNANGYEIDVRYIDNMHYIEITLQKRTINTEKEGQNMKRTFWYCNYPFYAVYYSAFRMQRNFQHTAVGI